MNHRSPTAWKARAPSYIDDDALPRFRLSSEVLDGGDAAETLERAPVRVRPRTQSRPWRSAPILSDALPQTTLMSRPDDRLERRPSVPVEVLEAAEVDDALEVELQDILMETYLEPPSSRPLPSPPTQALPTRRETTSSSLAPVALPTALVASVPPPPVLVAPFPPLVASPSGRSAWGIAAGVFVATLLVAIGGGAALMPGGVARLRSMASERVGLRPAPRSAPAAPAIVTATPPARVVEQAPVVEPEAVASALALPSAAVAPNMTAVLFHRGRGRRLTIDGRVVSGGPEPILVACGKHKVRVGAGGKSRLTHLPCGSVHPIE